MPATKPRRKRLSPAERATIRDEQLRVAAETQERADEGSARGPAGAPAAQRKAVDGLRGPRVEREQDANGRAGLVFITSNPIRHLAKISAVLIGRGHAPTVTRRHINAAERLLRAHRTAGEGVGMGHSNYGGTIGGVVTTGFISDGVCKAIGRQIDAHRERSAARIWVRDHLWEPIRAVVLDGVDVKAWATGRKQNARVALGYLMAALDALAAFYAMMDRGRRDADTVPVAIAPAALAAAFRASHVTNA